MRPPTKPTLFWFLLSLLLMPCLVAAQPPANAPTAAAVPPEIAAKGYILIDFNSSQTLAERNADERLEPASLTKIMTAYVVFRELAAGRVKLSDQVVVSEQAWRTGGSRMFIEVGTQVSVEDLLQGMIVQSGNDAAVALAEHVAGNVESFAKLMNTHAKRLGMSASQFTNPNGLPDPELYTTARDMARLAMALIREFPDYYKWYSQSEFTYGGITQQNRNPLLKRDPSADGVKTGFTNAAGYCLVGSAKRDDMRLISVVMGSATPNARAQASLALLNYGFRAYESHRLYSASQPIESLRVWFGEQELVPVGPAVDVFATIPRGAYNRLSARLEKTGELRAPLERGARVGDIVVSLGEREILRTPVIALQDTADGGLWRKAKDSVLQLF